MAVPATLSQVPGTRSTSPGGLHSPTSRVPLPGRRSPTWRAQGPELQLPPPQPQKSAEQLHRRRGGHRVSLRRGPVPSDDCWGPVAAHGSSSPSPPAAASNLSPQLRSRAPARARAAPPSSYRMDRGRQTLTPLLPTGSDSLDPSGLSHWVPGRAVLQDQMAGPVGAARLRRPNEKDGERRKSDVFLHRTRG
ncbi:hypothetical protein NDU88_009141 [Pleurodeles waltl]|uniref:Uncharacterized protein n=1 Tax=Pleurodeles waltl TaxID=8319 RepID=A0AAV7RXP8_PLEWA|nr:hypothetical protein NDU88_009141 [Pleurodeles waltl]